MLAQLLDIRKTIIISLAGAVFTAAFLFNIYILAGILILAFAVVRFGVRKVVIVFTLSTYLIVTSDLNEGLRNAVNGFNIICLILTVIYFEGINIKTINSLPSDLKWFIAAVLLSFIFSSLLSEYPAISLSTTLRQILFFIICLSYYFLIKSEKDFYLIIYTLIAISSVLGIGIVYQLLTQGIGTYYLESINAVRFSGLYNNPNAVGLFFTISIPLLFSFLFNSRTSDTKIKKTFLLILFSFVLICLFITNSRASIISVLVSIGYILFVFKRKVMIRISIAVLALALIIIMIPVIQEYFLFYIRADRIFSNTRTYFWSIAFDIIKDNPFFGAGPGVFEQYIYKYLPVTLGSFFEEQMYMASSGTAHNFFLFRTADLGIAGLITSISLFILFFKYSGRVIGYFRNSDKELHLLSVTIKSIGIGLLLRAFLESTGLLTHGWITRDLPFWIIFIILIILYQKVPKKLSMEIK